MSDEQDLQTEQEAGTEVSESRYTDGRREPALPEVKTVDEKKPHAPTFKKSTAREYFESAVVTLIMALFGMTFIVQAVKVPTGSMKNTIWVQDHMLVNKFIFGPHERLDVPVLRWLFPSRQIRRGDIIVFKYPRDPQTNYIKRVIGLPGEWIEIKGTTISINGEPLPEHVVYVKDQFIGPDGKPYPESTPLDPDHDEGPVAGARWTVYYDESREHSVRQKVEDEGIDFEPDDSPRRCYEYGVRGPFKVPVKGDPLPPEIAGNPQLRAVYDLDNDGKYDADQYFCMGDNRDNSEDSRCWGTVPRTSIVGHAMFVYWSIDRSANPGGSSNPITDILTRSRWWRTGTFIK